jgi:hypothetical protein
MAILRSDLTIDPTPCSTEVPGLTGHGHIQASYHHLRDRFGQPDRRSRPHRTTAAWTVDTPAGWVVLCRPSDMPSSAGGRDDTLPWMIMATTDAALPWIYKAVTGSTATFPAGARTHFSESTLESFVNGYRDYLHLRMDAELERRPLLDRSASDFWTAFRRPQQLNHMALEVAEVLHHYAWSQASTAEREAWAAMGRPTPGPARDDLAHMRAVGRWLYSPIKTEQNPHGGDPDLPGMLRALADTAQRHRPLLREQSREMDFALHAEHEQTLRALADTPIPGIDALQGWRS